MRGNSRINRWVEQVARRGRVYHVLADLFTQGPTRELVRSLLDGSFAALCISGQKARVADVLWAQPGRNGKRNTQALLDEMTAGVLWVEGAPESESVEALQEMLTQEYRRLLVVPNPRYVPPYESAYRGRYAMGAAYQELVRKSGSNGTACDVSDALQVEHFYTEAGWAVPEEWTACPDHIGVELRFMGHVCAREADAWRRLAVGHAKSWQGWQKAFLRIHLGGWVPGFCARLTQAAQHPFYVIVAAVTLHTVVNDLQGVW